jgi:molybdopterin synthase catalytic subunit
MRNKFQGHSIDAIALIFWGIESLTSEQMAEMTFAFGALNFGAQHAVGEVADQEEIFVVGCIIKSRPSAIRVEFMR